MQNKSVLLPLGSACVLFLLAACGGSSSGGDATDTQGAVNPGTVPSAPSAPNTPATPTTPVVSGTPTTPTAPTTPTTPATPTTPVASGTPVNNPPPVTPPADTGTNPLFLNADSGLSHPGQAIPKGTATTSLGDSFLSNVGRSKVESLPQTTAVVWEVVENHGSDLPISCQDLPANFSSCSLTNIHIKSTDGSLDDGNWRIYFPSIRRILRVDSDEFDIFLVNGDLNYITPSSGFTGFNGETTKSINVITEFSQLHQSDFMPRYFLVRDGAQPEIIANTNSTDSIDNYAVELTGDNRRAFNGEPHQLANSDNRFEKYSVVGLEDVSSAIVPTPLNTVVSGGTFDISGGISFGAGALPAASAAALNSRVNLLVGGGGNTIATTIDTNLQANTYVLTVAASGISIRGSDANAVFNGGQSLISLITPGSGSIPQVVVTDSPRFDYRGMHVDVARNFHSADRIKKMIDQMAAYKLNVLHLHLTDDEGWRLEIPGLPELTSVGGRRQFSVDENGDPSEVAGLLPQLGSGPFANTEGNGFFTRNEFIDLLRYANDRFVQVLPEIDMPAHARAAVVSMRARAANLGEPGNTNIRVDDPDDTSSYRTIQNYSDGILNPCIPGTYNFIETVVTEVKGMYDAAGVPLEIWHMGGDEANNIFKGSGFNSSVQAQFDFPWERSPACNALIASDANLNNLEDLNRNFVVRVSNIVRDADIPALYAYQDILRNIYAEDLNTQRAGVGNWEVVWQGGFSSAYEWPQRGFETIVAVPDYLYFDFPQEIDPEERGYYWATRFTDTQKVFSFVPENLPQNAETTLTRDGNPWSATGNVPITTGFDGMQGQLWGETVRTTEHFDFMMYPRLLALAERAWHKADWEIDYNPGVSFSATSNRTDRAALTAGWQRFANALGQKELAKLDAAGVLYRVPTAGARSDGNTLEMNTEFPGLQVQFSNDGNTWQTYNPANRPATAAFVRAVSASGSRTGRETPVN